jgi:hypothetical protein
VVSKIEIEIAKACILKFLDSSPGLLTQKIVSNHVLEATGMQLSPYQVKRIMK